MQAGCRLPQRAGFYATAHFGLPIGRVPEREGRAYGDGSRGVAMRWRRFRRRIFWKTRMNGPEDLVVLRSLRLPEADVRRIAKALAARMKEDIPSVPRAPRYGYRVRGGIEFVLHPGTEHKQRYLADPMDLSNTGLGLMHGNYVHQGTPCEVSLRTCDGEFLRVSGRVARCDCFCAPVHILGVHFDTRIEVQDFICAEAASGAASADVPGVPHIPPGVDAERLRTALHDLGALIFAGASLDVVRKRYEQICGRILEPCPCAARSHP